MTNLDIWFPLPQEFSGIQDPATLGPRESPDEEEETFPQGPELDPAIDPLNREPFEY